MDWKRIESSYDIEKAVMVKITHPDNDIHNLMFSGEIMTCLGYDYNSGLLRCHTDGGIVVWLKPRSCSYLT